MIRRNFWFVAPLAGVLIPIGSAQAAEISNKKIDGVNYVVINGLIGADDVTKFEVITDQSNEFSSGPTLVLLNSVGGNLLAGLSIGEAIRSHRLFTAVLNGSECASVCAIIWLTGTKRYLGNSAKIGFHAAYTGTGADAKEAGQANAIVGAYLSKLGLSYDAIAFATEAGPNEMQWLHPSDAERLGITLNIIPDIPQTAQTAPVEQNDSPAERRAKDFVQSYFAYWSRPGTDVEGLAQFYSDTATFYGGNQSRDKIMDAKRKFSVRWPVRHYTIKPNTLFVQCAETCSVTGVVEWDAASPERGAHSIGTANFVLKIALNSSALGGIILSENGAVLAAHNDALPSAQASLPASPANPAASPAYADGRKARIDYQAWFDALSPGEYRDGATFWTGSRSLKIPPSCKDLSKSAEWWAGCLAARDRLSPIDARRHTEKDYWLGWNSL